MNFPIDLSGCKQVIAERTIYTTETINFVVSSGKMFRVESSPDGIEFVIDTVPDGKTWAIHMNITIDETDA